MERNLEKVVDNYRRMIERAKKEGELIQEEKKEAETLAEIRRVSERGER